MPEAPEVYLITKQLAKHFINKELQAINIIGGRFVKVAPSNFTKLIFPTTISDISCKGKFIYWKLSNGMDLWNTLGMTGSWTKDKTTHSALELIIDNEKVYFTDPRRFGTVKFVQNNLLESKLNSLGLEFMNNNLSHMDFSDKIRWRCALHNKSIAEILMDQSKCCGVGNYIKSEALYLAKISPLRKVDDLTAEEIAILYNSIRTIMKESVKAGGATISTYKDFNGKVGTFSKQFKVYRKTLDPNGLKVISQTTADKRTSWWVPEVQK